MSSGFDRLAPLYDVLARMVYGNSIVSAQTHFLSRLPAGADVLILGGGTGWLLAELLKANPASKVCYVEASAAMLKLAKKKTGTDKRVLFIHGTEKNLPDRKFDAVIANFYFDLFSCSDLRKVIFKISTVARPNSILLAADFIDRTWWQKTLLVLMYWFFRITTDIGARRLPPWQLILKEEGIIIREEARFYRGFIRSLVASGLTKPT